MEELEGVAKDRVGGGRTRLRGGGREVRPDIHFREH